MPDLNTSVPRLRRLIDAAALHVDLPGFRGVTGSEMLEGLILTESNGQPGAMRYESHQDRNGRRDQRTDGDTPDYDDNTFEDDKSYGLMQVMGYNIRRLCGVQAGVPMDFTFALLPMTNIALGLRLLWGEMSAVARELGYPTPYRDVVVEHALARYNGGPTGDDISPKYGNDMRLRVYVEKVYTNAHRASLDRKEKGWVVF